MIDYESKPRLTAEQLTAVAQSVVQKLVAREGVVCDEVS